MLHGGDFKGGSPYDNGVDNVCTDLKNAGYYALAATYRLAPCGVIKGQHCHDDTSDGTASGRPLQQIDDVKRLVKAARTNSHYNGKLGIIGGSCGGTHAIWVTLDEATTQGGIDWDASDRPDCAVSLSGAYDFAQRIEEGYVGNVVGKFVKYVENYTNSCDPSVQRSQYSPISLVTYSDIKPIFLINSEEDSMPWHQILYMQCALQSQNVSTSLYKIMTIPGDAHSFGYWAAPDSAPVTVLTPLDKDDVISFLDAHLK